MNTDFAPIMLSRTKKPVLDGLFSIRNQWRVALIWFAGAGAIGLGLRGFMLWPANGLSYTYWLHAHSHVVLLGWAFNALLSALLVDFLPPTRIRTYRIWWIGLQVAVGGMLVFFPIQGYAAGSILFSTLHVWFSYGIGIKLWRDLRKNPALSASLLRWGIGLLFLSTLGPYAVGVLKARGLAATDWPNLAIYFYLHFLYNGWFVFGILALLVRQLEFWELSLPARAGRVWLAVSVASCLTGYSLSVLWSHPPTVVWAVGFASGTLQLGAGGWLLGQLWQRRTAFYERLTPWAFWLVRLSAVAFVLKLVLQFISAFPWAAALAYAQRPVVIAYLHLVFIGLVSFFLLGLAIQRGWLQISNWGLRILITFFILLEVVLVAQTVTGIMPVGFLPFAYEWLFFVSAGLWVGVLLLLARQFKGE